VKGEGQEELRGLFAKAFSVGEERSGRRKREKWTTKGGGGGFEKKNGELEENLSA